MGVAKNLPIIFLKGGNSGEETDEIPNRHGDAPDVGEFVPVQARHIGITIQLILKLDEN
jgi:hypothetical protein